MHGADVNGAFAPLHRLCTVCAPPVHTRRHRLPEAAAQNADLWGKASGTVIDEGGMPPIAVDVDAGDGKIVDAVRECLMG